MFGHQPLMVYLCVSECYVCPRTGCHYTNVDQRQGLQSSAYCAMASCRVNHFTNVNKRQGLQSSAHCAMSSCRVNHYSNVHKVARPSKLCSLCEPL